MNAVRSIAGDHAVANDEVGAVAGRLRAVDEDADHVIRTDGPGATILLNDDTVTRNSVGIGAANGGQLISYGNNKVNNNIGPDGAPTGSYSPI